MRINSIKNLKAVYELIKDKINELKKLQMKSIKKDQKLTRKILAIFKKVNTKYNLQPPFVHIFTKGPVIKLEFHNLHNNEFPPKFVNDIQEKLEAVDSQMYFENNKITLTLSF